MACRAVGIEDLFTGPSVSSKGWLSGDQNGGTGGSGTLGNLKDNAVLETEEHNNESPWALPDNSTHVCSRGARPIIRIDLG